MSNGSLAKRYARAIFSIAEELNVVEQFNTELIELTETLAMNDNELLTALTTPVFKLEERQKVASVIAERLGLDNTIKNFTMLLLEKDRLVLQSEIAQIFQVMADQKAGRVRASVQTAQGLSNEEQAEIRETLAASIQTTSDKLIIDFTINEDLIGGIWAKVGDTTYDATVRSKLQDMRSALLK
jgi:F-type H+-transporting ATPase subunit delta